jgi:hypothetical protein
VRPIKFRAWDKHDKRMSYSKNRWISTDLEIVGNVYEE